MTTPKNLMDQLPEVYICWKDVNSVFLGCNQQFANLIGKKPSEIIGVADHLSEKHVQDDKEVIETGQAKLAMRETIPDAQGKDIAILTNKGPLLDDTGKIIGTVVSFVKLDNA